MAAILVVDDSLGQLQQMKLVLETAGHVVQTADSWAQCRVAVREFRPDLVLMDVNLVGMSGGDVLAMQLRKLPSTQHAKLVFHSAIKESDLKVLVQRARGDGYIVKRPGHANLLPALEIYLSGLRSTASNGGSLI